MLMKTLVLISALIAGTSANLFTWRSRALSPFGIVEGITDCGSNGKLGVVQVTDCTTLPCQFTPNKIYDFSVIITAAVTSRSLQLGVIKADDFAPILEMPINGEIEAGKEYELKFQITVSTTFSGLEFPIRIFVLDTSDNRVEICANASIKVL